ncbi:MAG TPA: helix-turn-helix domain-containing protein [Streptosporangiaceae bacterium]|nr:helix-turn-helix domain-containing protein [Streptosporangiaceae bacterium]
MDLSPGYWEWAPPSALRHVLACLWTQVTHDAGTRPFLVLPDGCTDLIWQRGGDAFVAGPDTGPVPTLLTPGTVLVGARFRPGAGGDALGVPLSELRDQRVGLADLQRDVDRQLPGSLEPDEAVARITDIAGRLAVTGQPDGAVLQACRLLRRPEARTEDVAAQVGLSGRQLRRRCEAAVGYGPKMLQRVLRFRRFVSLVDASAGPSGQSGPVGPMDLARAAADTGYADQPHLTRETVRLAGLPPAALVRERLS